MEATLPATVDNRRCATSRAARSPRHRPSSARDQSPACPRCHLRSRHPRRHSIAPPRCAPDRQRPHSPCVGHGHIITVRHVSPAVRKRQPGLASPISRRTFTCVRWTRTQVIALQHPQGLPHRQAHPEDGGPIPHSLMQSCGTLAHTGSALLDADRSPESISQTARRDCPRRSLHRLRQSSPGQISPLYIASDTLGMRSELRASRHMRQVLYQRIAPARNRRAARAESTLRCRDVRACQPLRIRRSTSPAKRGD